MEYSVIQQLAWCTVHTACRGPMFLFLLPFAFWLFFFGFIFGLRIRALLIMARMASASPRKQLFKGYRIVRRFYFTTDEFIKILLTNDYGNVCYKIIYQHYVKLNNEINKNHDNTLWVRMRSHKLRFHICMVNIKSP